MLTWSIENERYERSIEQSSTHHRLLMLTENKGNNKVLSEESL